ncbi:MAG TPA: glycosyltransferase [Acidimicrobiales bacterium]|nr:glycosyltransferase [Acidimicrobiales bacterium]
MTFTTSLVIPAYNESLRLEAGFERLRPVLNEMNPELIEVVVVDDGSRDDTMHVAQSVYGHLPNVVFVRQPENRGKGAAVRLGISVARAPFVIATDADLSIRPVHLPDFVLALRDSPLVPGSRELDNDDGYDTFLRTLAGRVFNRLVRHYTGTTSRDTQCGCKGFQLGPARILGLLGFYDRFIYDAEMLFLAERLGLAIRPLSVTWDDIAGSTVHVGRDSLQMIRDLRSLKHRKYENPVVELEVTVDVDAVDQAARASRVQGLVIARGETNALVVLPREGAVAGVGIASALGGKLRTAGLAELRGRTFDAVTPKQ